MGKDIYTLEPNPIKDIQLDDQLIPPRQKGYFLPVLGLVILVIVAGAGSFYLRSSKSNKTEPTLNNANQNALQTTQVTKSNEKPTSAPLNQNKLDETVGWQIYESPNKEYSFKYPKDFTLSNYNEGTYKGVALRFLGSAQGRTETSLTDGLVIKTLIITNINQTLEDFAQSQRQVEMNALPEAPTVSSLSQLTLGGQTALTYTLGGTGNVKVVFVKLNSGILRISGLYEGATSAKIKYLNLFDQILSTLKFTAASINTNTSTSKTVTVPTNWKKYTAEDPDFGIKTSMSMPPGYSFKFTGSEFNIENDSDATELWDYSSSVYRNNNGVLKNHYDGSSRRTWYEKLLSERRGTDKIVSVKEKPLNSTTYLEITVQTPSYDDRGVTSGTKNGIHYVYILNKILHMITPASNKAYTSAAQIPTNIEPILASLTSVQAK